MDPIKIISDYVRFPSISASKTAQAGMQGAADYVQNFISQMGFETERVPTPLHPIILGKRTGFAGAPHVVLYGHYDVQPPEPLELWETPPFEPTVRNNRLYGRGTADNKGPQMALLIGLAQCLKKYPDLQLNITILIEGEEEISSPSFPQFLKQYADQLKADCIILSDTGSISTDQVVITTGLRGVAAFEVIATGPSKDLHSGVYGGAIVNPIRALCELCASLHNSSGAINIPGFYDAIVPVAPWERAELQKLSASGSDFLDTVGVSAFSKVPGYTPREATCFCPTIEFNGITGGYQGTGSKTIIPSRASVKITCRLVPGQTVEAVTQQLTQVLKDRCPKGVRLEVIPAHGGNPYAVIRSTDSTTNTVGFLDHCFNICENSIEQAFGKKPLFLKEGGSIPIIEQMKAATGMDSVMVGLVLPEDDIHAPNESMHLSMIHKGIAAFEALFTQLGHALKKTI